MMELLTLDEVAERLRVSRRSVERLVRARRLRVLHPVPGRTLVERRELEAYIAWARRA
jgi:excisionase family DNA binding protein